MAQKMLVIPEEMWTQQKTEDIERRKTVYPSLLKLESDIDELLDNDKINDYDKVKLLTQMQQRYKGIYSTKEPLKIRLEDDAVVPKIELTPADESKPTPDFVANEILLAAPKHSKSKIPTLLNFIKQSGRIGWDNQKRLVIGGQPMENTNIVDLISHLTRKANRSPKVKGWNEFITQLKHIGTPRELIGFKLYDQPMTGSGYYVPRTIPYYYQPLSRTPSPEDRILWEEV